MSTSSHSRAILLFSSPDQKGLVSKITGFIARYGGNIITLHEHVDSFDKTFFLRVDWDMEGFEILENEVKDAFNPVGRKFDANWNIQFTGRKLRVAVLVSKYEHCLQELLWRQRLPESAYEIPLIISNHPDLEPMAAYHQIPYHVFPITKENKHRSCRVETAERNN